MKFQLIWIIFALGWLIVLLILLIPVLIYRLFRVKDTEITPEIEKQMRESDQYSYDHLIDPDDDKAR